MLPYGRTVVNPGRRGPLSPGSRPGDACAASYTRRGTGSGVPPKLAAMHLTVHGRRVMMIRGERLMPGGASLSMIDPGSMRDFPQHFSLPALPIPNAVRLGRFDDTRYRYFTLDRLEQMCYTQIIRGCGKVGAQKIGNGRGGDPKRTLSKMSGVDEPKRHPGV